MSGTDSQPLSVRLREYVEAHPGSEFDSVILAVVDFRHEKASDAERILIVLVHSKRLVIYEEYDPTRDGFKQYLYPGVVPEPVVQDDSIDGRILSRVDAKPGIEMMSAAHSVSSACVVPVSKVLQIMFELIRLQRIYPVASYSPEARRFVTNLYPIDKVPEISGGRA